MARKTKEDTLKTYHSLLDAAITLFNLQGVGNTTLNQIAKHAGVTRGAFYWHFANKDEVIKALWERDASPVLANFSRQLATIDDPQPIPHFKQAIKATMQEVTETPAVRQAFRIALNSTESACQKSELESYLEIRAQEMFKVLESAVVELAQQQLLKTQNPKLLATSLWCYLRGLVEVSIRSEEIAAEVQQNSDLLIDMFLDPLFAG